MTTDEQRKIHVPVAMASVAWAVALRVQADAEVDFPTALSAVRKEFSSRWDREVGRNTSEVLEQVEEIYSDTVAALKASSEAKEAPMRARLLVLHRKEIYPGEFGPEVMAVADEYTLDQNPEWWENEVARQRDLVADDAAAWAEVDIEISADALMRALYPARKPLAVEVVGEEGS